MKARFRGGFRLNIEFSLVMPRDAMGIPMVRRIVRSLLRALGVAEECASDILIATSEACTNAVRHGDPATRYEVTARIHDERCELHVAVEDRGPGLPALPRRQPPADVENGRGMLIMRTVMDDVSYEVAPGRSTAVRLSKRLAWEKDALAPHLARLCCRCRDGERCAAV